MKFDTFVRAHSRARTEESVRLYLREAKRFQGWLGTRALTLEAVQEYEAWLTQYPHVPTLDAKAIVEAYRRWDSDIRARKTK